MTDATELDEAGIRETWLRQCGPCDAGLPMACVCSDADPRPVIERLLAALDEARAARLCSQCGERLACMVKVGTSDGWCADCLDEAAETKAIARAEAAESALVAVRAMDPARILSVPSEEAMLDFLTALNVSGLHPEVPCSVGIGMPFLAGLTEPDADHVHITVTDADSGVVHCCECSHPGERPDQWDPNSWAPHYPVLALVTEWPDMERVADETYIEPWWAPALATPTTLDATTTQGEAMTTTVADRRTSDHDCTTDTHCCSDCQTHDGCSCKPPTTPEETQP